MFREFYEACEKAARAKKSATALKYLNIALDNLHPLVAQARARLEFHACVDLMEDFRFSVASCVWNLSNGKDPGLPPWFFQAGGTTYVYPPTPKGGSSTLDYRWSKWQDRAESYLPSVGQNKYGPYRGYMRTEVG